MSIRLVVMIVVGWLTSIDATHAQHHATRDPNLLLNLLDPSGRILPDTTVIVVEDRHGRQWNCRTNHYGQCAFVLPPGTFIVIVDPTSGSLEGSLSVQIEPGMKHTDTLRLRYVARETIVVTGRPSSSNDRTATTTIVTRNDVEGLPTTNGRSLQTFQLGVPGMVVTDSVGTLATYTAAGQRRFANRLTIDGMSADLAVNVGVPGIGAASGSLPAFSTLGGTQTVIPPGAIEEIQIRTTAVDQPARSPGAQVAVVSRSGTDRWTGDGFVSVRPSALAAYDWFTNADGFVTERPRAWNLGSSAGGPLRTRRLLSFITWERQRIDRPLSMLLQVPSDSLRASAPDSLRPILDMFPHPDALAETAAGFANILHRFPMRSTLNTLSARLDARVAPGMVFMRIGLGRSASHGVNPSLQQPSSTSASEQTATGTITVGASSVFTWGAHDLRLNTTVHRGALWFADPASTDMRTVPLALSLFVAPGSSDANTWVSFSPFSRSLLVAGRANEGRLQQMEVADTWLFEHGPHRWRVGFDYRHLIVSTNPPSDRYTYRFRNFDEFIDGRVSLVYVEDLRPARVSLPSWSTFVQNEWRPASRLTLAYGLRHTIEPPPVSRNQMRPMFLDYERLPDIYPRGSESPLWRTSWKRIAPYAQASYRVDRAESRQTILSAGWNLTFDALTSPGASAFGRGYPYVSGRTVLRSAFPVPSSALSASPSSPFDADESTELFAFARDLRAPRTYAWHVAVDRDLVTAQRVSIAYVGTAGRDLVHQHGYFTADGRLMVRAFSNADRADYHGLLMQYVRSAARGLTARIAYTWSHAIDTDSGEAASPTPPPSRIPLIQNRGSADFDRRHVLHLIASARVPTLPLPVRLRPLAADWHVDAVFALRSGAPINIVIERYTEDGWFTLRPDVVPGVPLWIADPDEPLGRRINPGAFVVPEGPRQGTLGRNVLRASPLRQLDLSISRTIRVGGRIRAQWRFDAFNVLNVLNVGAPDGRLMTRDFGRAYQSYADALGSGTLTRGGLVPLEQLGGPMALQMTGRLTF